MFRDIDNIPPGVDFRQHIAKVLDESDILLAIVGPRCLGSRGGQNRLVEPGRLVRVEKVVEGIMATTFVVDPSDTTCTLTYQLQPDPKTGRTVAQALSGVVVELRSISVSAPSCTIRKGNVFASDQ